ncbi:DUF4129 domain-containing protein [Arthrobacter sp. zg-Y1219]|uniref:DUF4129 domain-containing protein n=1 Tax=Arthrobacter sp. zg-Y1219 TaxID=3049067 RepID=UPI0024C3641D|nr:DUF4129 domain-containing protein [Arthrobacter sp. zg-Y1219]MDK1359549.1 DUF4129 domain-containing protein [Arthrobacter sp. zg-Y1219]
MTPLLSAHPTADVPVLPDDLQGRDWAEQELSRSVYQEAKPSLLDRFWQWVREFFSDLLDGITGVDPSLGVLLLAVGAAAVLAVAIVLVRPRLNARSRRELFDAEETRVAVDHRRLSEEAAARGEWDTALAERLRAVIRSAEERVILEPRAGRTAAEAGHELALAFPAAAPDIRWLARRFDEVRYGHLRATAADSEQAAALDRLLEGSAPRTPATLPAALAVPR